MKDRPRWNMAIGLALILLGAWFLAVQFVPELGAYVEPTWPLIIVGVGLILLVMAVLAGVPGLAVPACIVGGIGGLLYWQNATGNWESWAYAWTLIPGFVGVGALLSGLMGGETREGAREGAWLILISLILFAVFGSLFGALGILGRYWPALLILLGLLLLAQTLFRSRR